MSREFTHSDLKHLREIGLIRQTEIVYQEGDLYIAKDVVTDAKRVIEVKGILSSSRKNEGRQVLKG